MELPKTVAARALVSTIHASPSSCRRPTPQRAEVAYADSALGVLFLESGRAAEAVLAFARSLAVNTVLAERHPTDLNAQVNLGQGHAWLADALQKRGHLADARRHRDIELSIYRAVLRVDPTLRQASVIGG